MKGHPGIRDEVRLLALARETITCRNRPLHPAQSAHGGNGNGLEGRVRKLEVEFARIDERLNALEKTIDRAAASLEKTMLLRIDHLKKSMASKAWVLGGVIGGGVFAAGLVLAAVKFLT